MVKSKEASFIEPNREADIDGIYSPLGGTKECIKIPDNCVGLIVSDGTLRIECDWKQWLPIYPIRGTLWPGRPRRVTREELEKARDFQNTKIHVQTETMISKDGHAALANVCRIVTCLLRGHSAKGEK